VCVENVEMKVFGIDAEVETMKIDGNFQSKHV
jgi:hypothetical protein